MGLTPGYEAADIKEDIQGALWDQIEAFANARPVPYTGVIGEAKMQFGNLYVTDSYGQQWLVEVRRGGDPVIAMLEHAEAAACLWEEALRLTQGEIADDPVAQAAAQERAQIGTASFRWRIIGLAEECHNDWLKATAEGYDGPFDWEFVPDWLRRKLVARYGIQED